MISHFWSDFFLYWAHSGETGVPWTAPLCWSSTSEIILDLVDQKQGYSHSAQEKISSYILTGQTPICWWRIVGPRGEIDLLQQVKKSCRPAAKAWPLCFNLVSYFKNKLDISVSNSHFSCVVVLFPWAQGELLSRTGVATEELTLLSWLMVRRW